MPKCFLVHGFDPTRQRQGKFTIDKLAPYVEKEGWKPTDFNYHSSWLMLRHHCRDINRIGERLAKKVNWGDVAIGHSTGAAVIYEALWAGASFRFVVFLHANLNSAPPFPTLYPRKVLVVSSPHDPVVRLSWMLIDNIMGSMGRTGYTGDDDRVTNVVRKAKTERVHVDLFDDDKLAEWGPKIAGWLAAQKATY